MKSTRLTGLAVGVAEAFNATLDLRGTVVPFVGLVTETCGGTGALTVMPTEGEVPEFPALSVATA